ncbi:MAG: hypothetical protein WBD05_05230 [Phycisphaerae bacterium]
MSPRTEAKERKRRRRWMLAAILAAGFLAIGSTAMSQQPAAEEEATEPEAGGAETAEPATNTPEPSVKVTEAGIILHVRNEDLTRVLEQLSRLGEVNLVASKGAKGTISADLYSVTLEEALDAICRANNLRWVREDNFIYVHTPEELDAIAKDEARMETRVFRLKYLTAVDAQKLITPALSGKHKIEVTTASETGIGSNSAQAGGDSYSLEDAIIIHDFPENLEEARKILEEMDRRPRQVLVEATILEVTLENDTSLGVNFNALAGVDFRDLTTPASPTTAGATVMADAADTTNAVPWGQAYTAGFATAGTGINIGVVTNNVSFFIHALEEVTDTTVLNNPKVLAVNKQRAEVKVGVQIGYVTTETSATTTTQTVEFMDTGTNLLFRPFIGDDGYIRMEIHPEVSSGVVRTVGDQQVPDKTSTEVTCNVMVKDGHTIVIGGLFKEDMTISRNQVPGLGNVPGLGWMFRSKENDTLRKEIIVLLTPHIIENYEEANALGEQLRDDAERRCLGMREGFYSFTTERMTVGYLHEADQAWRTFQETRTPKDLNRAWWYARLALNVAPNNLKALRLKDKILSEKHGKPMRPAPWTIWDTIRERLKPPDRTRGLKGETPAETPAAGPESRRAGTEPESEARGISEAESPPIEEKQTPAPQTGTTHDNQEPSVAGAIAEENHETN